MDPRERLLSHVRVDEVSGCWIWTSVIQRSGYGQISMPRGGGLPTTTRFAHRVSYELFVGPIPEGMTIDHVAARGCTSRACVNPAHLEAVTQAENNRRSARLRKQTCPAGHPYDKRNTFGYRICSICHRAAVARHRLAVPA